MHYLVVSSMLQVCLSEPPLEEVEQYERQLEGRGRENMLLYHRCHQWAAFHKSPGTLPC